MKIIISVHHDSTDSQEVPCKPASPREDDNTEIIIKTRQGSDSITSTRQAQFI